MNKIILSGRLARDPELKSTTTGIEVCNFCVAVDRRYTKGEDRQADFIDCTAWKQTGVFVDKYFKKGDGINLSGRLESRKYTDKDGNKRTAWSVTVDDVEFTIGGKKNTADNVNKDVSAPNMPSYAANSPGLEEISNDDDLPF